METRYEKVNYPNDEKRGEHTFQARQNYQNRQGYQNRTPGQGYQNYQGYQSHTDYNQNYNRQISDSAADSNHDSADNAELNENNQEVYQPRQGSYQPRQGSYQPRQANSGYQRNQGYQNNGQTYQRNNNFNQGYQRNQGYQNQQGYQRNQGYQNQQGYQRNQGYQNRQGNQGYQNRQGGQGYHNQGYQNYGPQGYQRNQGFGNQGYQRNQGFQRNQGAFRKGNNLKFTPRPKQIDYIIDDIDPNEEVRLNKYMANAGICSRREADEFIGKGLVKVNGVVVTELGTKIKHDDVVEYDEKVVVPERKCYVLLNKPKDCVTTSDDPNGRLTVLDIVKNACNERIYPVGRLDRNTTGVLLLTNDGDLASKLTHPKFVKKKIYHVWTDKDISEEDMQRIADGIELPDGEIHADAISYVSDTDHNQAGIEIHSGRNRIVRRIFEHLGYRVTKLDRVYFAGLTKKNLPRGRWRYLTQEEVTALRTGRFE
ncbi:MAG: RNA-binding S4 domain-containing protein [Muribaculaceae bacterium]|nr:RNA-binding S4 domain-containing protein [Muribaculaceae bacterium]